MAATEETSDFRKRRRRIHRKCRNGKSIDCPNYDDAKLQSSKSGEREEEQARSSCICFSFCDFLLPLQLQESHSSVAGPLSSFYRLCRAALLRVSEEWPMGHGSLPPHIRAVSVSQYPIPAHRPGVSSPLRVTARSCQSCSNVQ